MAEVADDAPLTVAELTVFAQDGRAWVYTDEADKPVGYLLMDLVDGGAHVEQVSVHPDYARRRIGYALLEIAAQWARQHGIKVLTLTTYADVPWNAPYYRTLGFEVMPDDDLGDGLLALREAESTRGLDRWRRVVMRRPTQRAAGPSGAGVTA